MAGVRKDSDMMTPYLGRGRGLLGVEEPVIGKPRVLIYSPLSPETPANQPVGPSASTPSNVHDNVAEQLRDLIGELGSQIGDSIVSRLLASQNPVTPSTSVPSNAVAPEPSNASRSLTNVSLIVKPDVREPPMFRGDGTDKHTVQEWIELMELYLHKADCSHTDQVDEILSHLLGRAKSIVKVRLKSSPNEAVSSGTIYDVLRRYFSESPGSCQPLADFYATHPKVNECPVDYWVRLNAAAELADSHLQSQGAKMKNMSSEIAMMFIRNCPEPGLSSVFRCKPISKWTVSEIQEAIDEHQRDVQSKKLPVSHEVNTVQVTAAKVSTYPHAAPKGESLNAAAPVYVPKSPLKAAEPAASEAGTLERVLSMLERVLERTSQTAPVQQPRATQWRSIPPCRVCGERNHSTRSHCMRERRCLSCLEIGHQQKQCHKVVNPAAPSTDQYAQGN
ncbi:Gag-Pol polyprotein [Labeo rohita]|uniref:Gag-Pol polyprotein n=1 Tax=Labeo rohita TaxID=84645 RepID=A0ABQ8LVP4_LABRO|nr:Gag-Pol polyprotein [Labeo rohita]